jgi:molecular chaperone DnaK
MGGIATRLIERNTTIPVQKSQIFSTATDNQTSVDIRVVQGERAMAADNKELGKFSLSGIPPAMRGVPQIEVTFDIDANGIVNVTAVDKGTGKKSNITITASSNLTEDDIEKAVEEAERYAEEDKKRKEVHDMKNNAENLIFAVDKFVQDNGDKVSEEEKAELEAASAKAREALDKTDNADEIKAITEELSKTSSPIFTKLYQQMGKAAEEAEGEEGASDGSVEEGTINVDPSDIE